MYLVICYNTETAYEEVRTDIKVAVGPFALPSTAQDYIEHQQYFRKYDNVEVITIDKIDW